MMVGAMSLMWWYCSRISPRASIPFGQWTTSASCGYERTPWMTLGMSPPKIILSAAGAS